MLSATHSVILTFDKPSRFGQVKSASACTQILDWQPAFIYDCHAAITKTNQDTTARTAAGCSEHICKILALCRNLPWKATFVAAVILKGH
jgi:hypothetical protein